MMAKRVRKAETLSLGALAPVLGRNRCTLTDYVHRGMPAEPDGKYNPDRCRAWIAENIGANRDRSKDRSPEEGYAYWNAYLVREKALRAEYERRQTEGELIEVDVVARHNAQRITHAKTLLEQIPDRLLGLLPAKIPARAKTDFRDRAAEMIESALFALAEPVGEEIQKPGTEDET